MKICEYKSEYQQRVVKLILHIQQDEFKIPISIDNQPDLMNIEDFYQREGNFWVALSGNEVVGTVALISIGNGNCVLRKMFVDEVYRGKDKGISGELLSQALKWADEKHFNNIFLGTTPNFVAAHRFYEKNNFIEINREELPETFPVMEVDKIFYRYHIK